MKQKKFKKLILIAVFAIVTITSATLNFCFGWSQCNVVITHPEHDACPECGYSLIEVCEEWYDQVFFHIHTYECRNCGRWIVYYEYPLIYKD